MPSLVNSTERTILTGSFNNWFDTFERRVIIYKEPIKTLVANTNQNMVFGFGESQAVDNYTYTEVTGVYPAVVRYKDQTIKLNSDMNAFLSEGEITMKVKRDARDFLNNGRTEKILVDDRTFSIDSDERRQTFLNSEFFVFKLKATK